MSMSCWKCGKEIEDDLTECPGCSGDAIVLAKAPIQYEIDWSKVKNFEELMLVLSIIKVYVSKDALIYPKLKPWLKDEPHNES